ncbi:hypothetical protein [Caballeronia sp. SEWSISQ10-4 2]|nr:hypothetical protein [Caballeronia sp. SEWSISQ10-4 2]
MSYDDWIMAGVNEWYGDIREMTSEEREERARQDAEAKEDAEA